MGIVDKLRNELIDIVEWVDDSRHTLVWRFPRYHNQIKNGAQLIVRPGQEAVFVHRGRIADVFTPGQHTLSTKNLPVLSTLQGWKYGFDSPFKSEVYFVSTRQITELKWGTPHPVMMRDADFGPVRLRAFGSYTLKAEDPATLLRELVGTDSAFDADEISELLRSIINSTFADLVASSGISVLDLASNYMELSEKLRQAVIEKVDDEYGLDIPLLYIVNFSLPAEVEKALDARSGMGIVGDLGQYQQYQIGSAMPTAAANPAGGLAGAGLGMGMGMAVAGQMMPGLGGGAATGVVDPPPAPPAAPTWHVVVNGATTGPYSQEQLVAAAAQGQLRPDTLVWSAGMDGWMQAAQVPELASAFGPPSPPPPPVPEG